MNAFAAAAADEDGDEINALRARVAELEARLSASQPGGIPPGWKLVPVEPTSEMKSAGAFAAARANAVSYRPVGAYIPVDVMALMSYRAMLDAAPQPPVVEQPQGEQEPFTVLVRKRSWLANQ